MNRVVCWFSCGAASAVATKLAIAKYELLWDVVVVRCIVREEHPDNDRFAADCEKWFGQPILNLMNTDYDGSVMKVIEKRKYISGVAGAPCTMLLKKQVREQFQRPDDLHIFGYCADEQDRYDRFLDANNIQCEAPLLDRGLSHADTLGMIQNAGIELPAMYQLGYLYGAMYNDTYANDYAKAYFANGKMEAAQFFDSTPTQAGHISGLPKHFKTLPKPGNAAYTLGFIAGLVASDGCVSKSGVTIANKDQAVIEGVVDLCASIGLLAYLQSTRTRSTNYKKGANLSTLLIPKDSFHIEWLVRSFHKERFGTKRTKSKAWRIDAITPAEADEVFCVTVKDGPPEFTLAGNILTGNCQGCVKATGQGYWNKIRTDFPDKFWQMAGASRALGVRMVEAKGKRIYLDELEPGTGRYQDEPEIQCGIFCEMAERELAGA